MTPILSPNWRGQRAEYIDPASIRFKAVESPSIDPDDACKGCIFATQTSAVCNHASRIAMENDFPDCGDISPNGRDYVYVPDKSDPRQLDLVRALNEGD